MKKQNETSWGRVADWYEDYLSGPDSYQSKVILPNILRIVEPRRGMDILDLACGQGFFSFEFARKGSKVVGVDIAKELIEKAKAENIKLKTKIEFHVSVASDLHFLKDESFDVITIVLAAQNIKDLHKVFSECNRVLKKDGRLILVLNHPAFRIPQSSDWHFNEKTNKQGRIVTRYMSEQEIKIKMNPGKDKTKETISFHRPLQVYFKWLTKNNFAVTKLEEWISHKRSEKGPRQNSEDEARKEIPLFMCLESKKS